MSDKHTELKIQTICLMAIAAMMLIYAVYWLRPVLLPFVVALFVVSGIMPMLVVLETRLRVNRLIAAAITFMVGLFVLISLGACIWLSAQQLADQSEAYRAHVSGIISTVQSWIADPSNPASSDTPDDDILRNTLSDFGDSLDLSLSRGLTWISGELLQLASTSVVVLIYVFFILLGNAERDARSTLYKIDQQIREYLFMKTIISVFTGVLFGFALWLFGVPMSLTFGLLAFLLNFIPNIGPIVASLLPIPFIVLHPEGSVLWMIAAIGVTNAIQVVSGNIVEPKLMGDSADLHPVAILLGLMFWGMVWGITGMFLATPITAAIKIILERFDSTKGIAEIMAGRLGSVGNK